jgi:hypothetical protein
VGAVCFLWGLAMTIETDSTIKVRFETSTGWLAKAKMQKSVEKTFKHCDLVLIEKDDEEVYRGLDPTILVAIISAGSAALGVFLTGILRIAKEMKAREIKFKSGDRELIVPADLSEHEIDANIERLHKMSRQEVTLSLIHQENVNE